MNKKIKLIHGVYYENSYFWNSDKWYEGEVTISNGYIVPHGKGVFCNKRLSFYGEFYYGEFKEGKLEFTDKSYVKGKWKNNKLHGIIDIYYSKKHSKKKSYRALWQKNKVKRHIKLL